MENLDRRYLAAGLVILLILVFTAGVKYADFRSQDREKQITIESDKTDSLEQTGAETDQKNEIQVYVCGEVEMPGVYKLKEGARLFEAVEIAGAKPGADLDSLDMARELVDGESIPVSAAGEELEGSGVTAAPAGSQPGQSTGRTSSTQGKVNINKATAQEMDDRLAGIGPALSQRIVDYRISNGPFQQIEDLKDVSGIGDKKFEAIKDMISVR